MPTFDRAGVTLAYDDSGGGPAPIVLLHGLSSARSTWDALVQALAPHHRVVRVDHRGHGQSSHAPGTYVLEHYSADAIALCESVVREPAVLVGHSLGGVVAAEVARVRPDIVR